MEEKDRYEILTADAAPTLELQVEHYLRAGWRLVGGVSIALHPRMTGATLYAQAVHKPGVTMLTALPPAGTKGA